MPQALFTVDLKPKNFLVSNGKLSVVDFEIVCDTKAGGLLR